MKEIRKLIDNDNITFEDIAVLKQDIRQKIGDKQDQLLINAKNLVPFSKPSSLSTSLINPIALLAAPFKKGKTLMIVEGIVLGYKLVKNIRRFFRR